VSPSTTRGRSNAVIQHIPYAFNKLALTLQMTCTYKAHFTWWMEICKLQQACADEVYSEG
jgi:hypothetical protein